MEKAIIANHRAARSQLELSSVSRSARARVDKRDKTAADRAARLVRTDIRVLNNEIKAANEEAITRGNPRAESEGEYAPLAGVQKGGKRARNVPWHLIKTSVAIRRPLRST